MAKKIIKPAKKVSSKAKKSTIKSETVDKLDVKQQEVQNDKNLIIKPLVAIVLFFISLLFIIACISYFYTWQEDQSITSWAILGIDSNQKAINVCGPLGAVVARMFIGKWFGIFGVIIPFILTLLAVNILLIKKIALFKYITILLTFMIVGSIIVCYFSEPMNGIFGTTLGGGVGYVIHSWMFKTFGEAGELIMLSMLFVLVVFYVFRNIVKLLFRTLLTIEGICKYLYDRFVISSKKKVIHKITASSNVVKIGDENHMIPVFEKPLVPLNEFYTQNEDYIGEPLSEKNQVEPVYFADNKEDDLYAQDETYDSQNETYNSQNEMYDSQNEIPQEDDNRQYNTFDDYDLNENNINNFDNLEPNEYDDQDDIQDEYSEQIDQFNSSIGVIEREDSFEFEATVIEGGNSPFSADSTFFTDNINTDDNSVSDSTEHNNLLKGDDVVVLPSNMFSDYNEQVLDSDEFELYKRNSIVNDPKEQIIFTESEINEDIEQPSVPTTPKVKQIIDDSESFTIERTEHDESEFEVFVTDNVNIDLDDNDEMKLVGINSFESFNDEDIDSSVYDPTKSLSRYKLPVIDLMDNHTKKVNVTNEELFENKNRILETLNNFNIKIDKIKATIGPTVTLYEIIPAAGVRISKIKNLEDDIALSLSALGIRIIAPIPGKGTIGIEVPNKDKEIVSMYSVIKSAKFQESDAELPIVLGRTIQNEDYVIDLAKTPHMLVAGATGQGKSVGLNAIITSLLYKKHPAELKFVFVDPKKVELTLYTMLERHFLAKLPGEDESIITDTQKVVYTLNSLCLLMDTRYDVLKNAKVRNIKEYNDKFTARRLNPNKGHDFMPYFVVVIDEFADLIMTAGREVETPIARLAQLGRATGIHLVIATQRPTTNIITGVIKANFPTRVAFRVSSMIDSRTILDQPGANQLIGRGDMLVSNGNDVTRVQCAFIDTPEVERICEFIGKQTGYGSAYELPEYIPEAAPGKESKDSDRGVTLRKDTIFDEVARYVVTSQQGSASTVQRNFSIGFNRAGRIMDQLERNGIVGRQDGSKPRQVLIQDIASLEVILYDMENSNNRY